MKILIALLYICLGFYAQIFAQEKSVWRTLEGVKFETRQSAGYQIDVPVFGKEVKALEGKIVTIKGYILPLEVSGKNKFIFSSLPYSACYFCGGAGPETVMEVSAKNSVTYSSKPVTLRGKLKLNESDFNHLMYMLVDAEKVD